MSEQLKSARNVAIIVAIAAAVYFIPGGGRVASTFEATLWVAFAIGLGYLGLRLYRERRVSVHGLGDRHRGLLYAGTMLAFFVYAARKHWETGLGELVWFVMIACVIYAFLEVFRHSRTF